MTNLHWELAVLTKAIHHKNLTGAAAHVGLSQPQLSRIIAKLEGELGVVLLDRSARRKSGWTKAAFDLASVYSRANERLESEVQSIALKAEPSTLHVATLEGIAERAKDLCRKIFEETDVNTIDLQVLDLPDIEEKFLIGDLDLAFTMREPGKQKLSHSILLGYQSIDFMKGDSNYEVLSQYEYNILSKTEKKKKTKRLVSNSLFIRRAWIEKFGGSGTIPSDIKTKKSKEEDPVLLIGNPLISPIFWGKISKMI